MESGVLRQALEYLMNIYRNMFMVVVDLECVFA